VRQLVDPLLPQQVQTALFEELPERLKRKSLATE
jgi:hypothetical protein